MHIEEASRILKRMYNNAPYGKKECAIHFFAIKYADQIQDMSKKEIVIGAEMRESFQTEINKGVNLAQYVTIDRTPPWAE